MSFRAAYGNAQAYAHDGAHCYRTFQPSRTQPNPCAGDYLTGSIGLFAAVHDGYAPLSPTPGPPELPLFAFSSPGTEVGSINFDIAPVPEPSTLFLLGSGLGGLAMLRRLRKK